MARKNLTPEEIKAAQEALLGKAYAKNTREGHAHAWSLFNSWCTAQTPRRSALPASVDDVMDYLTTLQLEGLAGATIRYHRNSIRFYHHQADIISPTHDPKVMKLMKGIVKEARASKQAPAITRDMAVKLFAFLDQRREEAKKKAADLDRKTWRLRSELEGIEKNNLPRIRRLKKRITSLHTTRNNILRSRKVDERTVLLVKVMRAGLLRRQETADLRWRNLTWEEDGAVAHIEKSKTDQQGKGAYFSMGRGTAKALKRWRELCYPHLRGKDVPEDDRVFGITQPETINRTIREAFDDAGLGKRFTSHGCRIGMAIDLRSRGISLEDIRIAGRWKRTQTLRHYLKQYDVKVNPVRELFPDD